MVQEASGNKISEVTNPNFSPKQKTTYTPKPLRVKILGYQTQTLLCTGMRNDNITHQATNLSQEGDSMKHCTHLTNTADTFWLSKSLIRVVPGSRRSPACWSFCATPRGGCRVRTAPCRARSPTTWRTTKTCACPADPGQMSHQISRRKRAHVTVLSIVLR